MWLGILSVVYFGWIHRHSQTSPMNYSGMYNKSEVGERERKDTPQSFRLRCTSFQKQCIHIHDVRKV